MNKFYCVNYDKFLYTENNGSFISLELPSFKLYVYANFNCMDTFIFKDAHNQKMNLLAVNL